MTYIEYINHFWQKDEEGSFSAVDTRVFFYILHSFNRRKWQEPIECSNNKMICMIGISENTLKASRERLAKAGLIKYEQGKRKNEPTKYWLLVSNADTKIQERVSNADTETKRVSTLVSNADTETKRVSTLVSTLVSTADTETPKRVSTLVSNADTLYKTKTLKEKDKEKERVCVCLNTRDTQNTTHTQNDFVLKIYSFCREYAPYCASHLAMPTKVQCEWLMRTWEERDIFERIVRLENNKSASENARVLYTTIKTWLENDEAEGRIRRKQEQRQQETERPKEYNPSMIVMEARKGNQRAIEELEKKGVAWR